MKSLIFKIIAIILVCVSSSSCATMTRWFDSSEKNKKMYTVTIRSKTPGLMVYTTENGIDYFQGTTPCRIYSDKCKIKYVTVRNGDVYQTVKLGTKPRISSYWNFVPYPMYNWIWGFFLDQGTGRGKTYGQKEYFVDM